jgi:rhamnogalacturonan endolyase
MKVRKKNFFIFLFVIIADASIGHAERFMENINRGLVAVPIPGGTYLSWRLFGTESYTTGFNVYKGSTKLNPTLLTDATIFTDITPGSGLYTVRPVLNDQEGLVSEHARIFTKNYWPIPLQLPPSGVFHGNAFSYSANDASTADLDGDGQYDIVLKWDPSNAQDNSIAGYSGPQILDGLKMDGTLLWRINLGRNIRSGAHYTQFMVYDLDGDGHAEVVCKTAPNTMDGTGQFIHLGPAATADHNADYTNALGRILTGPEYLTIFDGLTGKELATVNYVPGREKIGAWGGVGGNGGNDSYGNRPDRFTACIAYLDGQRPSVIMGRGYYGRTVLAAWDWRGGKLTSRWIFDSKDDQNPYSGQGAHGISVADVDADGKDEIIFGAMTLDDDGTGMYTTGFRHGDALHVGDLDPKRPGLEVYMIHENEGNANTSPGSEMHSAKTGEVYWKTAIGTDVGRGVAADVDAAHDGDEFWGAGNLLDTQGKSIGGTPGSQNFVVWWDGDLMRELENGTSISKVGAGTLLNATGCSSNNSTKSTPSLTADLFGDWREEVMWRSADNKELRIYTTTIPTQYRFYTLMHNPEYRMAVAWQNVAYNQPPHVDYYLGTGMSFPPPKPGIVTDATLALTTPLNGRVQHVAGHMLRVHGSREIALPWGYSSDRQIVTLRDSFGRIKAKARPDHGYLHGTANLPIGTYFLESDPIK